MARVYQDFDSLRSQKSILCTSAYFEHKEAQEYLKKHLGSEYEVTFASLRTNPITEESFDSHPLKRSEILIADPFFPDRISPYLDKCAVKWIHSTSSGVNQLLDNTAFKEYMKKRMGPDSSPELSPLPVMTRTSYTAPMVVYCMAHICSIQHNLAVYRQQQAQSTWNKSLATRPLSSKVVGVLGVGDVGCGVAAACKHLDMTTVGYSANTTHKEHFDKIFTGDLVAFLKECDFIVNALPSSPKTIQLLSGNTLEAASQKSPVFINIGRGSIIDDDSIIKALDSKWISQAVLDVTDPEPLPKESKLWSHPRVTITPHISGGPLIDETYPYITEAFIRNLNLLKEDKPMCMVVDYTKGY
ncbi:glyoxylate/hydroxypyruvate reductase A-like isoform X2 [Convolutriloba macropyga]|uniref:glyoxylate/hydroxypyruvate reductase A-like isoform X2 n=1 Tax=Convolutriloba macropyga TaxID=536237 RepID=UPI003F523A99